MAQPLSDRSFSAKPVHPSAVPPHLICKSCSQLLVNCFQTSHGYQLCQPCFATKLHPTHLGTCPGSSETDDARERMASQATCCPDTATRRAVSEVLVHCPNAEAGCPEQVQLKHVDSHLVGACEHEIVTCPLCSGQIVRCQQYSGHLNLESDKCCTNFWAYCPRCGDTSRTLNAETFVEHVQNACPVVPADCKYACVGCRETPQRQHLCEHYRCCTDEHLEQTVKRLLLESEQKDRRFEEVLQLLQAVQGRLDAIEVDRSRENNASSAAHELLNTLMSMLVLQEERNLELKEHLEQTVKQLLARLDAIEVNRIRENNASSAAHELLRTRLVLQEKRNLELEEQICTLRGATNDRGQVDKSPPSPTHRSTPRAAGHLRRGSLQMTVLTTAAAGHGSAMRSIWVVNNRVSSQQLPEEPSSVPETPTGGKKAQLGMHRRCQSWQVPDAHVVQQTDNS